MKLVLSVLMVFVSLSLYAADREFHLIYSDIGPDDLDIQPALTHSKVLAKIEDLRKDLNENQIELKIFKRAPYQLVLSSLQNPKVYGILWIGHSEVKHHTVQDDEGNDKNEIYNFNMKDSHRKIFPKGLFTAAHPQLKILGLTTCNISKIKTHYFGKSMGDFKPQYVTLIPNKVDLPPDHPLYHFFDLADTKLSTIDLIEQIQTELKNGVPPLVEVGEQRELEIKIDFTDLFSGTYVYEVFANGQFVGELKRPEAGGPFGPPSGKVRIQMRVPVATSTLNLKIRPNDQYRFAPNYPHPVDNIWVSKVVVVENGKELFLWNEGANIGDQDFLDETLPNNLHPMNKKKMERGFQEQLQLEVEL